MPYTLLANAILSVDVPGALKSNRKSEKPKNDPVQSPVGSVVSEVAKNRKP
jgi:hypothetical protein